MGIVDAQLSADINLLPTVPLNHLQTTFMPFTNMFWIIYKVRPRKLSAHNLVNEVLCEI